MACYCYYPAGNEAIKEVVVLYSTSNFVLNFNQARTFSGKRKLSWYGYGYSK